MAMMQKELIDPPVLHNKPLAFILFVMNAVLPGFHTCKLWTVLMGILQYLTTPLVFGWVWSALWGWELWALASHVGLEAVDIREGTVNPREEATFTPPLRTAARIFLPPRILLWR